MGETYSWASPEVVSRMTVPQLMLYLKSDEKRALGARPRPANAFASKADREAYIATIRAEKGLD